VLQQELPWWQHEQVHQAPQPQQQQQQLSGHQHHSTTTTMHQGDTSRKGGSTAAAAGGHRTAAGSGSSKPTGRVVSLSAAPRRPVGPDGQPITFVDGGFDHLGDCTLKYLVSYQSRVSGVRGSMANGQEVVVGRPGLHIQYEGG
jgi:hypothetical protein